ncbi:hypothetical protein BT63DRAFT_460528 [Microthyrium microscopicum]|uniref:SEC7 domain-containing protein n=1 Tax=Microthyrium microscopicum TaxID=703497 RepID=A0A6A6TYI5_9PEZI|nr:hypothetical protein BT63DRAFT_460528 [Microthyrium microscopicum]
MDTRPPDVLHRPRDRDSHDLSVQLTRYSVVDSMLLSLAGFPGDPSAALPSTFDPNLVQPVPPTSTHPDPYLVPPQPNGQPTRAHSHSSSYSELKTTNIDDIASKYSAYHAQARANAPLVPTPRTPDAARSRNTNSFPPSTALAPNATEAEMPYPTRSSSKHARKTSNGSNKDMGAVPVLSGHASPMVHVPTRGASFDTSVHDGGLRNTSRRAPRPPPLSSPEPEIYDYDDADAAPTPTIPGGPRRHKDSISSTAPPSVTPRKGPSRQNSVKSSRTFRKSKAAQQQNGNPNQDPSTIMDQARQFVSATNNLRNAQVVSTSASSVPSAVTSPTAASRLKSIPSPPAHAPKEKTGFFRRVFGGSSKHQKEEEPPATSSTTSERPRTQPSQQYSSSSYKSISRPPTQGADSSSRGDNVNQHHTLRKSSSSFFRRHRKRSIDQNMDAIPPVPPLNFPTQQSQQVQQPQQPPQHAAVNKINLMPGLRGSEDYSLRNVMAPYLSNDSSKHGHVPASQLSEKSSPLMNPLSNNASLQAEALGNSGPTRIASASGAIRTREDGDSRQLPTRSFSDLPSSSPTLDTSTSFYDSTHESSTLVDSLHSEAPMPSRPAPVPKKASSLGVHIPTSRDHLSLSVRTSSNDRPLLSPISDRSFYSAHRSLSSGTAARPQLDVDDDFLIPQESANSSHSSPQPPRNNRVWLRPSDSEEKIGERAKQQSETAKTFNGLFSEPLSVDFEEDNDKDIFHSVESLPIVQIDAKNVDMSSASNITDQDRELAQQIYDGDETNITKSSAAAWLGQNAAPNARTRHAYMELYDWTGSNILASFRELCTRLILRAESQELDRVIDAFSDRWCEANPAHGFKDKHVVHILAYSLLMLNTDLHIAESAQRMTRSQFVKNTLPTLRSVADSSVENSETIRQRQKQDRGALSTDNPSTPLTPQFAQGERPSLDVIVNRNRFSRLPPTRSDSEGGPPEGEGSNILVNAPWEGSMKGWEAQVETVLKEFYTSIRTVHLPLHGSNERSTSELPRGRQQSGATLSVVASALRRTPSVLSKAPSENASFRGRPGDMRSSQSRFASKSRNRPRMYPSSTFTFGSSRTSLDDGSMWSPAASTFTKHSFGKTQTSMSVESLGTWTRGLAPIGFANAVSRKIIREENAADNIASSADSIDLEGRAIPLLENEDLELQGAPWAKEGILTHIQWTGTNGKRHKERNRPVEIFAVVSKGCMRLFSFPGSQSTSGKSALRHLRQHKNKPSSSSGNSGKVVGGGNWQDNASELGEFTLRQTWAVADLKSRSASDKLTWYLHLPTGEIHAFIVNSVELAEEWTWTVNYWSARLSRQPLIGGVSSEEYGWSDHLLSSSSHPPSTSHTSSPGQSSQPTSTPHTRPGSSTSHASLSNSHASRTSLTLPGDRAHLSEWRPPAYSVNTSQLHEVDQKSALEDYLVSLDEEFSHHSEVRPHMANAFTARHGNAAKALTNWTRRANYLTGEHVKYKTYIGALERAGKKKEVVEAEMEKAAALKGDDGELEKEMVVQT